MISAEAGASDPQANTTAELYAMLMKRSKKKATQTTGIHARGNTFDNRVPQTKQV